MFTSHKSFVFIRYRNRVLDTAILGSVFVMCVKGHCLKSPCENGKHDCRAAPVLASITIRGDDAHPGTYCQETCSEKERRLALRGRRLLSDMACPSAPPTA